MHNQVMHYTDGETCANGVDRSVEVHVSCGTENKVLRVEEDGMCIYTMWFETPFMCSIDHAVALRRKLEGKRTDGVDSHNQVNHEEGDEEGEEEGEEQEDADFESALGWAIAAAAGG